MQPVSKLLYLGGFLGAFGAATALFFIGIVLNALDRRSQSPVGAGAFCMGFLVILGGMIIYFSFIAKMWSVIQDGRPGVRCTPGEAVGYHFVPFYNLYWIFPATYGWAQDFNHYVKRRQMSVPQMPEGLALATCIIQLLTALPYLGLLMVPVYLVMRAIFIALACDAINHLIAEKRLRRAEAVENNDNPFA